MLKGLVLGANLYYFIYINDFHENVGMISKFETLKKIKITIVSEGTADTGLHRK